MRSTSDRRNVRFSRRTRTIPAPSKLNFTHFQNSQQTQGVLECADRPRLDKWLKNHVHGDHRVQNIAAVVVSAGLFASERFIERWYNPQMALQSSEHQVRLRVPNDMYIKLWRWDSTTQLEEVGMVTAIVLSRARM